MIPSSADPPAWTVPGWGAIPGLRHAFFGRAGGVSEGPFASLNCSQRVGDEEDSVRENLSRAARALACERILLPRQVHGDRIEVLGAEDEEIGEADGLVVQGRGTAAGVLTADCVPLFLIVPQARLAAVVHAGWKGTALGIASRAVDLLCRTSALPPSSIHAALGPAIDGCCYEVGEEVVNGIATAAGRGCAGVVRRNRDKAWIDLRTINADILKRSAVPGDQIATVGPCTRCAAEQLFSHRASGGRTGRQLSALGWS